MGKAVQVYREPFNAASIPDDVLIQEWKRRRVGLREKRGKFFLQKKFLTCPFCKVRGSTREMRAHICPKAPPGPLSQARIDELRKKHKEGKISLVQLALNAGISTMTAWLVVNNRTHKKKRAS